MKITLTTSENDLNDPLNDRFGHAPKFSAATMLEALNQYQSNKLSEASSSDVDGHRHET
jgi:hypothetical protein